ncbi:hypothetical protein F5884DRAFT_828661 [Xylogone sp. PMI_703]|nr:hypothetical protein F5884DRAFT_828661 [Xylogone sp. PMI_703]
MGKTVIHSVLLFDGYSISPNATVTFDTTSGLITSVLRSNNDETFPEGVTVINGSGCSLFPGLIDAHVHCYHIHLPPDTDTSFILRAPLKSGVTTVCDMHSDLSAVKKLRQEAADELAYAKRSGGMVSMSDLKSSLYAATIQGGWPKPIVLGETPSEELKAYVSGFPNLTIENAADFVRMNKASGADYIKLIQEDCCSLVFPSNQLQVPTLGLQTAVVEAAHAEDMLVVGHALDAGSTEVILQSGADGLTHTFVDQAPPESIIELYKKTGAFVIPTLTLLSSLTNENQSRRDKFAEIAHKRGIIDNTGRETMADALGIKAPEAKLEYAYQTVRRLKKEGIDIVAGTDSSVGLKGLASGPSLWQELEMYVEECGFSITDALATATSVTAKRFGFHDRGAISEGKRADLVLVKGDITQKLQNMWDGEGIVGVWKEGLKLGSA